MESKEQRVESRAQKHIDLASRTIVVAGLTACMLGPGALVRVTGTAPQWAFNGLRVAMELKGAEWFAYAVIAFGVGIMIHEIGHSVAALVVGARLVEFSFGPFVLRRRGQAARWTAIFRANFRSFPALGYVRMAPPPRRTVARAMAILLGGSLGNLVTLLLCIAVLQAINFIPPPVAKLALLLGLWSYGLGFTNLMPIYLGRLPCDGVWVWELTPRRTRARAAATAALFWLNCIDALGVRPEDWPCDDVARVRELSVGRSALAQQGAALLVARNFATRGHGDAALLLREAAGRPIAAFTSRLPIFRSLLAYAAARDGDVAMAERLGAGTTRRPTTVHQALAKVAYLQAKKRPDEAKKEAAAWQDMDPGPTLGSDKLWHRLLGVEGARPRLRGPSRERAAPSFPSCGSIHGPKK